MIFATAVLIITGETDDDIDAIYTAIHRASTSRGYLTGVQIRETTRKIEQ